MPTLDLLFTATALCAAGGYLARRLLKARGHTRRNPTAHRSPCGGCGCAAWKHRAALLKFNQSGRRDPA